MLMWLPQSYTAADIIIDSIWRWILGSWLSAPGLAEADAAGAWAQS